MTDPISDMLTRIRNASAVGKKSVILPASKIKLNMAKILERDGWIEKAEVIEGGVEKGKKNVLPELKLTLKYKNKKTPAISFLKRVSRPGLKVYAGKNELPKVLNNLGMAIISTSEGLMSDKEARAKGVGGEVICEIY